MGCTVSELLERCSSRELSEWAAFWRLEPWGDMRADLRAGIIASTVANVMSGKKGRTTTPADFMPYQEKQEQTEEDMQSRLLSAVRGKVTDGNSR